MTQAALRASLSRLAAGDIDIRDARSAIREAMKAGKGLPDIAGAALRDTAFRVIASREPDPDLPLWYDLSTHAAGLARRAARADLAERFIAYAELIAQAGRFGDRQPLAEVLERKHVQEILVALASGSGELPRTQLASKTRLADANLSRVLGILSAHGLVRRRRDGKQAHITLSEAGRRLVAKLGHAVVTPSATPATEWWRSLSWPAGLWSATSESVGINEPLREFAAMIGCDTPSMLNYGDWKQALDSVIEDRQQAELPGTYDVRLLKDQWYRVVEERLENGERLVMLFDISATMAVQVDLKQRVAKAREQLQEARSELAATQAALEEYRRRLVSYSTWLDQLKLVVTRETSSLASRVQTWLVRFRTPSLRGEAEAAERQIAALKNAFQAGLYTSLWSDELPSPALPIDTGLLINRAVEAVETLTSHRIDVDMPSLHSLARVKAHAPELQALLVHSLYQFVNDQPSTRCAVKVEYTNKRLHVLYLIASRLGRANTRPMKWYADRADASQIIEAGLGHAHDLAETVGGTISVPKDQSYLVMDLPVEPVATRSRMVPLVISR